MFPDLFSIGPLTVHTYGLFVATGFIVAILVTIRLGRMQGIEAQKVMDMGFIMMIWAIIGSRLTYVFMNFSYYLNRPLDVLKIWEGGLVFSGGLILVFLAMVWYLRRHHLSFRKIGDLWAPGVVIGQAIGRIGCFMAGCCYGRPTDLNWGVIFTHPKSLAPLSISIHPTQLYSALSGFIVFLILMALHPKKRFDGQIFLWFLILHSTGRLVIERFRGDFRGLIPGTGMSITQLMALLILVASVITLLVMKPRHDNVEGEPPNR